LSKEALYELEKLYPSYIEEIFEFAVYRVKKLNQKKEKAITLLKKHEVKYKMPDIDDDIFVDKLDTFKAKENRAGKIFYSQIIERIIYGSEVNQSEE